MHSIYQAAPTSNSVVNRNTPTTYHMPVPESRKASQLIMSNRIDDEQSNKEDTRDRDTDTSNDKEAKVTPSIEVGSATRDAKSPSPSSVSKASYSKTEGITKQELPSSGSKDSRASSPSNNRSQVGKGDTSPLSTADSRISALGLNSNETKKPCIANLLNG